MRNVTIVESNVEPNKEHLWFYNGKLKWFGPNGWEEINPQVLSPTTTPKPVVTTTTTSTTTSTPFPTTTTSTLPPTTTTTTTVPATFKLTNNTGDLLRVEGAGYIDGMVNTTIPHIPNGGSVLLLKSNWHILLYSGLDSTLRIKVDGEDRGELSPLGQGSPLYEIPQYIFFSATEISVYISNNTSTTTSKPNVK